MFYSSPAPRYVEGWMWNRTRGETLALTIEMPYSFYNNNPEKEWVTTQSLKENGVFMLRAVSDYLQWDIPGRHLIEGTIRKNKTVYRYPALPAGVYNLYIWEDAWVLYDTFEQKRRASVMSFVRTQTSTEALARESFVREGVFSVIDGGFHG